MLYQPGEKKRRRRRPPSPPASLVRLLQTDRKVLSYFESLQEALATDVQIWKDRATAAEAALHQHQPSKETTTPTERSARDHNKKENSKASLAGVSPSTGNELSNTPKAATYPHPEYDAGDVGVPIDDDILDFDNLSSSSSSVSSSLAKPSSVDEPLKVNNSVDHNYCFPEQSVEESSQINSLLAESLATLAEFGVFLSVQPTNIVKDTAKSKTEPTQQFNPTTNDPASNATKENISIVAATIVGPQHRTDREIVADLLDVLGRSNSISLHDQIRLFRAIVLMDSFHDRRIIVDRLMDRLGHGHWKVWLHLWRNDVSAASVAVMSFVLDSIASDKSPRMQDLDAALFPPNKIASLFSGDIPWLETHISSLFGDEGLNCCRKTLNIAFNYLRHRLEESQPVVGEDEKTNPDEEGHALNHIENTFGWGPTTEEENPGIEQLVVTMRKSCPKMHPPAMEDQAMKLWLVLMKILLVTLEKECVPQDFLPENEEEWDIVCYMQRYRYMDAIRQHEPINSFPTVDSTWKTQSVDDPRLICKIIACAAWLADGQEFIDSGQLLLQQKLDKKDPNDAIQCLRISMELVLVRVINLEQRRDRMTAFVCQCMREGLLCIKGVTPLDVSSVAEYGNYAYDGRGRLIEATQRLESFVPGGVTALNKLVASHWIPNDLKPFDRDAPAIERAARISPTEMACALSHVSCWRGIQRSLNLDPPDSDIHIPWVRNPAQLRRLFKISGFASGAALLAENFGFAPAPVCVVLEDDAILVEGFAQRLSELLQGLPRDFHFCSLGYSRPKSAPIIPLPGTCVGVPSMLWYLTGYCLSSRGADYLLESLPVVGPVDSWIGLKMAHENWDNPWGMKIGIGAHAQPESLPKRKDLAQIIKFHAYCALKPLCSQKVRIDATRTAGSLVAPGTGRNWRQRDTDVEYSGHVV